MVIMPVRGLALDFAVSRSHPDGERSEPCQDLRWNREILPETDCRAVSPEILTGSLRSPSGWDRATYLPTARRFAAPNWFTVNGWPAMVIVPVRGLALAFAAIE